MATVGAMVLMVVLSGSPFTYPLDDTYIHLAVARTLADVGVWGLQGADPAAASSSPVFACLLALVRLLFGEFGFLWAPLWINAIFMGLTVMLWGRILEGHPHRFIFLGVLSLAIPLPVIGFLGMEHSLQVFITTALLWIASQAIAENRRDKGASWGIFFLSAIAVGVRYESLAIVLPLVGFTLLRRQWWIAVALVLGSILPILGFGLLWIQNGGWMLPNPVMIKPLTHVQGMGFTKYVVSFFSNAFAHASGLMTVAVLIATVTGLSSNARRRFDVVLNDWRWIFGSTVVFAAMAQLIFGKVGWLYRYEAWLVGLAALSIASTWGNSQRRSTVYLTLSLLFLFGVVRAGFSMKMAVQAPFDRWLEHATPADFVLKNYANQTIVANDIGHLAWASPSTRVLDLYGLANNESASMRVTKRTTPDAIMAWSLKEKASIAIVQICWPEVSRNLPDEWRLVAVWRIPRNVVFNDYNIGFFSVGEENFAELNKNLHNFKVPKEIDVTYPEDTNSRLHGLTNRDLRSETPIQDCL